MSSSHKSDVFICDESDLLLKDHIISFKKLPHSSTIDLRGLAAVYHGQRTYFMSATYDS